jgi:hypothetical protein
MVLSYVLIAGAVYHFVFIPQRARIEKYMVEKSKVEYTLMKITSSPSLIMSLNETIGKASVRSNDFEWLDAGGVDAGLVFYNYIAGTAKKNNLDLLETSVLKGTSSRDVQLGKKYYGWKVRFSGGFNHVLHFVDDVESNRRFLMIREIGVVGRGQEEDSQPLYELIFRGLKKDNGDVKKTQG